MKFRHAKIVLMVMMIAVIFIGCGKKENKKVVDMELENFFAKLSEVYQMQNVERDISGCYSNGLLQYKAVESEKFIEENITDLDASIPNAQNKAMVNRAFWVEYILLFKNGIRSGVFHTEQVSNNINPEPHDESFFKGIVVYHITNPELLAACENGEIIIAEIYTNWEQVDSEIVVNEEYKLVVTQKIKTVVNGKFVAVYDGIENEQQFVDAFKSIK
jgi:hypothetical protein